MRHTIARSIVALVAGMFACQELPPAPNDLTVGSPGPLVPFVRELANMEGTGLVTVSIMLPLNYREYHVRDILFEGSLPQIPRIIIRTDYPPWNGTWVPFGCTAKPERHVLNGRDRQDLCEMRSSRFVERDLEVVFAGKPALLTCSVEFWSERESQIAWDICASMKVIAIRSSTPGSRDNHRL